MTSFYSQEELAELGIKKFGKNVLLSKKVSIYGAENIEIGDNVRIDDFCILSGQVKIGSYVHIGAFSALFGGEAGIELRDFSGLSSKCVIYAESDDYSGAALTNPTIPNEFRNVIGGKVTLMKYVILGTGVSVLPNLVIGEGVAVGSMSLVNKTLEEWWIYAGVPCKKISERDRKLLEDEKHLLEGDRIK